VAESAYNVALYLPAGRQERANLSSRRRGKADKSFILRQLGGKWQKRQFEKDYGIERLGCVAKLLILDIRLI